jgi:membrane protein
VTCIASFCATYWSLGAAVGIRLWPYVSAYAVLLWAEFNARPEETGGAAIRLSRPKNTGDEAG